MANLFYSVLLITPYTAPIKLQVQFNCVFVSIYSIVLNRFSKGLPTQSPATAVRNILIPRFSQNPCASTDFSKFLAAPALLAETLRFLGNPHAYSAFFKNPAPTNRLFCLVIAFFLWFLHAKIFYASNFCQDCLLKNTPFLYTTSVSKKGEGIGEDGTNMTPLS
jgi:hypothetical protein